MRGSTRKGITIAAVILALVLGVAVYWQSDGLIANAASNVDAARISYESDQADVAQIPVLEAEEQQDLQRLALYPVGPMTEPAFLTYLSVLSARHHVGFSNIAFVAASPAPSPSQPRAAPAPVAGDTSSNLPPGAQPEALNTGTGAPATVSIRLSAAIDKHYHLSPATVAALPVAPTNVFVEHPFTMTISGAYRDVLFTLADLSRGVALIRVESAPTLTGSTSLATGVTVKADVHATLLEITPTIAALRRSIRAQDQPRMQGALAVPARIHRTNVKRHAARRGALFERHLRAKDRR